MKKSDELEIIREGYEKAKQLAVELWVDGDHEGTPNDFYYFQCGFVAGMNYVDDEKYKSQKKRLEALQKLSDLDQEFLDTLQQFVTKYDKQNRSYPESEYEGLSFYSFVCSQLGVEDNSLNIRNNNPHIYDHRYN